MEQLAWGPGSDIYGPTSFNVPNKPRFFIYLDEGIAGFAIPDTVVLGLEIRKPLASAIKTADITDLNGTFCPDKKCRVSWEITMPVLTNKAAVRTLTSQLTLVGEDSGCLLVQIDASSDRTLVYCPAGVPTPAGQDYFVSGDNEKLDRVGRPHPADQARTRT